MRRLGILPLLLLAMLAVMGQSYDPSSYPATRDSYPGLGRAQGANVDTLSFLFCTDLGYNAAAVTAGYISAIGDTGTTYTETIRDISGGNFRYWYANRPTPAVEMWNANYIATRVSIGAAVPHTSQVSGWFWWDLDEVKNHPALSFGGTVVEAYLVISPQTGLAFGAADWLCAYLDTTASAAAAAAAPAQSGKDGTTRRVTWVNANNATTTAWSDSLGSRNDTYDYGIPGVRLLDPPFDDAGAAVKLDVTAPVQAYLDMELNNGGFCILGSRNPGSSITLSIAADRAPVLVVKVSTAPYSRPWGGDYLAAVVLATDDFDTCNTSQGPLVASYGWRMSIAGGIKQLDDRNGGDLQHMSVAQLNALRLAGHEVCYHSHGHYATNDGARAALYNINAIAATEAGYDSLLAECRPDSFYARLGIAVPANRAFVTPGGWSSSPLQAVLDSLGYNFVRSTGSGAAAWQKAISHLKPGQSVNLMNVGMWVNTTDIFGSASANDSTAIAEALRDAINASHVTYGDAMVMIFWHDTYDSAHYASVGANNAQIEDLLEIVQASGRIRIVTYQQGLTLWRKSGGTVGALQ